MGLPQQGQARSQSAEIEALIHANVVAFILTSGNATGPELGAAFVAALDRMRRICRTHTRPVIATVTIHGIVTVFHGQRRGGVRRS